MALVAAVSRRYVLGSRYEPAGPEGRGRLWVYGFGKLISQEQLLLCVWLTAGPREGFGLSEGNAKCFVPKDWASKHSAPPRYETVTQSHVEALLTRALPAQHEVRFTVRTPKS